MAREPNNLGKLYLPADVEIQSLPDDIRLPTPRYFPPPTTTTPEGLVCVGGRLAPDWLLDAYGHGIFPWPMWDDEPVAWWSPDPRAIIELGAIRVSRRLLRTLRSGRFRVTCDRDFEGVIRGCATVGDRQDNTWLTPPMIDAYCRMHSLGHAHSVEVWSDPPLPLGEGRGEGAFVRSAPAWLPADVLKFARGLRKSPTDAESLIWALLRNRRLAQYEFRRQHPINPYVLDFYCHERRLAIELDGRQHNTPQHRNSDEKRTRFLSRHGIRVLRFWNHEVLRDTDAVLHEIWNSLHNEQGTLTPNPSPKGRGELVGGTYGIAIGGLFAAESMFHRERDASKVALVHLVAHLRARGYDLLDIQQLTPHSASMGAVEITRAEYLRRLVRATELPVTFGGELAGDAEGPATSAR